MKPLCFALSLNRCHHHDGNISCMNMTGIPSIRNICLNGLLVAYISILLPAVVQGKRASFETTFVLLFVNITHGISARKRSTTSVG